jgi:hypothetical protein
MYPTLARITMDICTIPTSSVLCKQLFSGGAETATDYHSHLGAKHFEQLQMLKFSWHKTLANSAQANSGIVEEVLLDEYKDFILVDEGIVQWEKCSDI